MSVLLYTFFAHKSNLGSKISTKTKSQLALESQKNSKLNAPGRIFTLKKQKSKTYFPKKRPGRIIGKLRYPN